MHDFLCCLFFYVLAFALWNTAFGSWPDFQSAAPYFAYYGPRMLLVVVPPELGFLVSGYFKRKRKTAC